MIHDTIIARASAPGSAMRGIVRVSGPRAIAVTNTVVVPPNTLVLEQRSHCLNTRISLPMFPSFPAKLLLWKEGHSYTGDETVEIHTIGAPVILDAIMAALLSTSDTVRLANPGEFTLRSFLAGRLDLAQAEAVLGVIDSTNNTDLKTALRQLAGNVSVPFSSVRKHLFELLAQLEASLDFVDEEIPAVSSEELRHTLSETLTQIEQIRKKINRRGIMDGKARIVLTGLPNVGKSTLFNRLVGHEAALVSPTSGTTRDYLEAEINWEGIPGILIDTAGIDGGRVTADELDESAQTKALEILEQADVVVYCYEDSSHTDKQGHDIENTIFFQTKTTHESLDLLIKEITMHLRRQPECGMLPNTALRCHESLFAAGEALRRAQTLTDGSLIALELRNAVNQLGLIDGTTHTEDILDAIFSRFCIGK